MKIDNVQAFLDYNFVPLSKVSIIKEFSALWLFTLLSSIFWLNFKPMLYFLAFVVCVITISCLLLILTSKSEKYKRFIFDAIWCSWLTVIFLLAAIKCAESTYNKSFPLSLLFLLIICVILFLHIGIQNIKKGTHKRTRSQSIGVFTTIGVLSAFSFSRIILWRHTSITIIMIVMPIIFGLLAIAFAISASTCYLKLYYRRKYNIIV